MLAALGAALALHLMPASASDFSQPWKNPDRALIIDAYEYNPIDWDKLVTDKRIVGFINKASDGLAPAYSCKGDETEVRLCKALWRRHAVTRELYQTRRAMAKALGLKWGAYHLARPGNPIDQANNFLDFAQPGPDDLMAIDIEENDPKKWMSLEDAEQFVRHIQSRTGRYPILYTNGSTAQYIAENRGKYPLLSRLPLWYARYKQEIGPHFPKGNWQSYTLWQFAARANCNAKSCPYRVPGTPTDIDVNVASMNPDELRSAWPFGKLHDIREDLIAKAPAGREVAANGDTTMAYASAPQSGPLAALESALSGKHAAKPGHTEAEVPLPDLLALPEGSLLSRFGNYVSSLRDRMVEWSLGGQELPPGLDPTVSGATPPKADRL
ncbi:glycoside hydrolase family 25 protein [Pseudaminobacter soli (ex Li et al. 2025)]|uniref:Muramidase n=1 Tax=Pseudaminobacter soli (ex Li et al. 2025) TaxID=1295366 RepID=A0A2P7SG59_9HYPH|nr:GH25 family lysozyme [Mesorhizobium soli]PSJ61463.1 muramidase [Mesorhizobium soli]